MKYIIKIAIDNEGLKAGQEVSAEIAKQYPDFVKSVGAEAPSAEHKSSVEAKVEESKPKKKSTMFSKKAKK
jgi:hypothetical protein